MFMPYHRLLIFEIFRAGTGIWTGVPVHDQDLNPTMEARSHRAAIRWLPLALAVVLVPAACGGDGDKSTPLEPDPPVPATVIVDADTLHFVSLGDSAVVTAGVRDQHGEPIAKAAIVWMSADPAVATVDAHGRVLAVANGSTTITASLGTLADSAIVIVAQRPATLALDPDTVAVLEGDTTRLGAVVRDANGAEIHEPAIDWSST